jgi:hypothetical protein
VAIKASNPSHITTVPREGFQLAAMKLSEVASNTQIWMCPKIFTMDFVKSCEGCSIQVPLEEPPVPKPLKVLNRNFDGSTDSRFLLSSSNQLRIASGSTCNGNKGGFADGLWKLLNLQATSFICKCFDKCNHHPTVKNLI